MSGFKMIMTDREAAPNNILAFPDFHLNTLPDPSKPNEYILNPLTWTRNK
jgi:hypothetical protein